MKRIKRIKETLKNTNINNTREFKNMDKISLKGKTVVISGASRGIGLAVAKRLSKEGANIVILAKTTKPHPKLKGTIYTAAKEIKKQGGKVLPLKCDIRFEEEIKDCIKKIIKKFKKIDILINNASAIDISNTEKITIKKFDLLNNINTRGTFLLTKLCLPYLKKSENPHILNMALLFDPKYFKGRVAYSIAKMGMAMTVLGWSKEFKKYGISVNALWPKTAIATSAIEFILGGEKILRRSRTPEILADAAFVILSSKGRWSGKFFIDELVLRFFGIDNFEKYKNYPDCEETDLIVII